MSASDQRTLLPEGRNEHVEDVSKYYVRRVLIAGIDHVVFQGFYANRLFELNMSPVVWHYLGTTATPTNNTTVHTVISFENASRGS